MTGAPSREPAPPSVPAREAPAQSSPYSQLPFAAAFGHGEPVERTDRGYVWKLSLGAIGVVYGDIGTSPLYALRECFHGSHAIPITHANVLGVLSLMIWSLILIVTLKYLVYVLRADNKGEGGILALMALVMSKLTTRALASRGHRLRDFRRRALVRRRSHHSRHHGAFRHRGPFHRSARDLDVRRRPHHVAHPAGPVRDSAARNRGHRHRVRADHGGLVSGARCCSACCTSATSRACFAACSRRTR